MVEVTGRTLRTDKSWLYLVECVWKRGKWVAYDALMDLSLAYITSNGN